MLPRAPLGHIINDLCFSPDNTFSIGCIFQKCQSCNYGTMYSVTSRLKCKIRPANSHGFTVRLTVQGINSRSHDLASKSHGESENLEIAKQFRQYEAILKNRVENGQICHILCLRESWVQFRPHSRETIGQYRCAQVSGEARAVNS